MRERIPENADFRCEKRKYHKKQSDQTKNYERCFVSAATRFMRIKKSCFKDIYDRGGKKENSDIQPIRRFADDAVIGVKKDRNQGDPEKNPT